MGKLIAGFTHSLRFVFTAHSESLGGWRSRPEQRGLERIPSSAMGWQLAARVSWLPRLEASHMICFSHQRESDCYRPLVCFSHDLGLWVFARRPFSRTQRDFYTRRLPRMALRYLKGYRKYQTFCQLLWVSPPPHPTPCYWE